MVEVGDDLGVDMRGFSLYLIDDKDCFGCYATTNPALLKMAIPVSEVVVPQTFEKVLRHEITHVNFYWLNMVLKALSWLGALFSLWLFRRRSWLDRLLFVVLVLLVGFFLGELLPDFVAGMWESFFLYVFGVCFFVFFFVSTLKGWDRLLRKRFRRFVGLD